MEHNENSAKRKTHSSEYLQKKLERAYTSRLTAHLKGIQQKEANIPKRSRLQVIIKLRTKISQVETKRAIQRINQTRSLILLKNRQDSLSQTNQGTQRKYPNQQNQK